MIIEYIFTKMGFVVSNTGILYTKNRFARFIANLGVREGSFKMIQPNLYSLVKK
jgi:hypothetical protein